MSDEIDTATTSMAPNDVFLCDLDGLMVTGKGCARLSSALSGIQTIAAILLQLEIDKDCTGGMSASTVTTSGLINALGVCSDFARGIVDGDNFNSRPVGVGSADYKAIEEFVFRKVRHG